MTGPRELAAALASAVVRSDEGTKLGRVRDVYRRDRGGDLAAVSVVLGRFRSRHVLVPATAFTVAMGEDSGHGVELRLVGSAADLTGAVEAPETLHADPDLLARAADALGVAPPDAQAAPPDAQAAPRDAQAALTDVPAAPTDASA